MGLLEILQRARTAVSAEFRMQQAIERAGLRGVALYFEPAYAVARKDHREIRLHPSTAAGPFLSSIIDNFDYHHSSVVPRKSEGVSVVDFATPQVHRLTRISKDVELFFSEHFIAVRDGECEIRINPAHVAYLWDVAVFFEYYHSAVFPEKKQGLSTVDYSRPRVHRLVRSGVEFEFPSLPEPDETTEPYLAALRIQPGDIVLDLGAYAGASAYFLSKAVGPHGLVASFEPDEVTFRYLKANVARHGLANVKIFKKGIWSETTTLAFQSEGNMGSSVVQVLGRNSNVKRIGVVTLDDALILEGAPRVAAIKMDIEGAELAVLRNAGDFLRRHRPNLIIEVHFIDGRRPVEEICEILRANDYLVELPLQGSGGEGLVAAWPNSPKAKG